MFFCKVNKSDTPKQKKMNNNKTAKNKIFVLTAPALSFIAMIVLIRLSDYQKASLVKYNIMVNFSFLLIFYAVFAWMVVFLKTKPLEKKYGLSRDRWHTVYPKTIISIVCTICLSYLTMCIGAYSGFGPIGIVISTLGYVVAYQLITFFL